MAKLTTKTHKMRLFLAVLMAVGYGMLHNHMNAMAQEEEAVDEQEVLQSGLRDELALALDYPSGMMQEMKDEVDAAIAQGADVALPSQYSLLKYPILFSLIVKQLTMGAYDDESLNLKREYLKILDTFLKQKGVSPTMVGNGFMDDKLVESLTLLMAPFASAQLDPDIDISNQELLNKLVRFGANLKTKNTYGETGIHYLARKANLYILTQEYRLKNTHTLDTHGMHTPFSDPLLAVHWFNKALATIEKAYPDEETFLANTCINFEEPLTISRWWNGRSLITMPMQENIKQAILKLRDRCNARKKNLAQQVVLGLRGEQTTSEKDVTQRQLTGRQLPPELLMRLADYTGAPKISDEPNALNTAQQAVEEYPAGKYQSTGRVIAPATSTANAVPAKGPVKQQVSTYSTYQQIMGDDK